MLSRDHIEFCIDEGVCCHCGKTIRWGQDAVYTINGAHYECQFPEGRSKALDVRPVSYTHLTLPTIYSV